VHRTRCFHPIENGLRVFGLVIPWTWPKGSRIFLGQTEVHTLAPPSAPRAPKPGPRPLRWKTARLPRLATTVVAVVGVAPCQHQRIHTVTTHTPAPTLPSPALDPCPQPLQGGWLVCRSWSSQARTPQQTILTSTSLVASTTHPGNPGPGGGAQSASVPPSLCFWQLSVAASSQYVGWV
jgi:hypothetical protein